MKLTKKLLLSTIAISALAVVSCKKEYLDTTPTTQIAVGELFKTTKNAYTLLNGMHNLATAPGAGGQTNPLDFGFAGLNLCDDIMAEDIVITNSPYDWAIFHYQYQSTASGSYWMPFNIWTFCYKVINNANTLIAGIDAAQGPESEKDDIRGQALAYRAYAYYILVNRFSTHYNAPGGLAAKGVPIYTEPTTATTTHQGRGTVGAVYDQIFDDIEKSVESLSKTTVSHSLDKSNITLAVARGIYARIALTTRKWELAADNAELARFQFSLMSTTQLTSGMNSSQVGEWMWASNLTAEQNNGRGLRNFIGWMDERGTGYANAGAHRFWTKALADKVAPGDERSKWFDASTRMQNKFRFANPSNRDFHDLLMRAGEMYLIEAEARYHMNDEPTAFAILTQLVGARYTDPTLYTPPTSGTALLDEILLQRKIELWAEGQAYNDVLRLQKGLNRSTGAGNHLSSVTGGVNSLSANSPRFLYKIPQREIDANDAMGVDDQNP